MNTPHPSLPCVLHASIRLEGKADRRNEEFAHHTERALKRVTFVVEGFEGKVVRHGNNEMEALFPGPEQAIVASCEMQSRVNQLPPVSGLRLGLRVGLQCGEAELAGDKLIGEAVAIAAGLVSQAMPGQILAGHRTVSALPPTLRHVLRPLVLHPDEGAPHESPVMEVDSSSVTGGRIIPSAVEPDNRLRLHDGRRDYVVEVTSRGLSLGRDPDCDIVIHDPRASRRHAWIGHRNNRFILEDHSSNGTFITYADGSEHMVKHTEVPLAGRGSIAFGQDFNEGPREVFQFEIIA